jgi:transposase
MFRWFVGLSMDASVWDVTVFTKNRDRLFEGVIARDGFGGGLGGIRAKISCESDT